MSPRRLRSAFVAALLAVTVACGEDAGTVTSTQPVPTVGWSRALDQDTALGGDLDKVMSSVVAGGPLLVAVGGDFSGGDWDAAVWTSSDGLVWSQVPYDSTRDRVHLGGHYAQMMYSVVAGGPGFVAVGASEGIGNDFDAKVWTSPDGLEWTAVSSDHFGGHSTQRMRSVVVGGPGLVAVGEALGERLDAAVWTSPDGLVWTRVPDDEEVLGGDLHQQLYSVVAGGPGLVAVGTDESGGDADAAVWTSPDGLVWSRVSNDSAPFGGPGAQGMTSVVVGGPGLIAVGSDGSGGDFDAAVWTSPDGLVWTRVPDDEEVLGGDLHQQLYSVVAGGSGLVAVGTDESGGDADAAVWTSPDGLVWTRVPDDEAVLGGGLDQQMTSVVAGGPGLVAVGIDSSSGFQDAAIWTWFSG